MMKRYSAESYTRDIRTAKVGVLDSIKAKEGHTPCTSTLYKALTTDKYKDKVQALREETDEKKQEAMKSRLPAFYGSGCFDEQGTFRHNGFLLLDIDAKDNRHILGFEQLTWVLNNDKSLLPYVALCMKSCRGKGFVMAIPIANPAKHREHYQELTRLFAENGLNVDAQCSNPNRKRYFSFDEAERIYYNPDAVPFDGLPAETKTDKPQHVPHEPVAKRLEDVERAYRQLKQNNLEYCPDYESYQQLALILAPTFGEDARSLYYDICALSGNYSEEDAERRYDDAIVRAEGKVGLGTFFYKVQDILATHQLKADFDFTNN